MNNLIEDIQYWVSKRGYRKYMAFLIFLFHSIQSDGELQNH